MPQRLYIEPAYKLPLVLELPQLLRFGTSSSRRTRPCTRASECVRVDACEWMRASGCVRVDACVWLCASVCMRGYACECMRASVCVQVVACE
eukprot:6206721-Pleurochrysis_carterae.AAC.1